MSAHPNYAGSGVPKSALDLVERVFADVEYDGDFEVEFVKEIPDENHGRSGRRQACRIIGDTDYGCHRCSPKIRIVAGLTPQQTEGTVLHEMAHVLGAGGYGWSGHDRNFFATAFTLYRLYGRPEWFEQHVAHDTWVDRNGMYTAKSMGIGELIPDWVREHHKEDRMFSKLHSQVFSKLHQMEPAGRLKFINDNRLAHGKDVATEKYGWMEAIPTDDGMLVYIAEKLHVEPKYIPVLVGDDDW